MINPQLVLTEDVYDQESYVSQTELSRAMLENPTILSPIVTQMSYALGGQFTEVNFPMLALTHGTGTQTAVKGFEYLYAVMGKPKLTSIIAKTTVGATDHVGQGRGEFNIYFKDKWFFAQQLIYLVKNGSQKYTMRVEKSPEQAGNMWKYTVKLFGGSNADYIPGSLLVAGTIISGGVAISPIEDSDGVESRRQLFGQATNMTSFVRSSTNITGNVSNKVMKFKIKIDGYAPMDNYLDWNLFLSDMDFNNKVETHLWWSKYTKDNKEFTNYDTLTSKPITSGAGIDEQITNFTTFSELTYERLSRIITDITFSTGAKKSNIVLWTGKGGLIIFNDAMMDKLRALGFTVSSDKFVEGSTSWDMTFGGFFKSFKHIHGHTITVIEHPMFDYGSMARGADKHPQYPNMPLTSFDMYFVDMTNYNGDANVKFVYEEGREPQKYYVNGNIEFAGSPKSIIRSSAVDKASVQQTKSVGVQIHNNSACFKLFCTAS